MLKICGTWMSRTSRCLWALEETGASYEHVPTPVSETQSPAHLKLNPNGHIPVIDDEGFILWESMAINIYIAEKYGKPPLWPATFQGRAAVNQWSFWAMTEVEPSLMVIFHERMFAAPEQRNEPAIAQAIETVNKPMRVIEQQLGKSAYLLDDEFTLADLNTASVWVLGAMGGLDFSAAPKTQAWLTRCLSRPANQRAQKKP